MTANRNLSRRVVLKGLGLSVALPWLEAGHLWGGELTPAGAKPPRRFACLFQGDGISPPLWWSKGDGAAMELGESLRSLAPYREQLNVIHGLYNAKAGGGHPTCAGSILSGASMARGRVIRGGVSMDQKLARHFEDDTFLPSLVLACEQPVSGYHESQYSMVYSSHISWQNPNSPIPVELHPSLAFDSLFGSQASKLQGSILDQVREQAQSLRLRVSNSDRLKIDEYLTSVRDTEQRLEKLEKQERDEEPDTALAGQRPMEEPKNFRESARLMCDIIALAFQTDRSRLATLLLSRDLSGQVYPFLDIHDDHHSLSHKNTEADYQKIVNFHVEQYAYLVDRLARMQEGDGTVLDNSCLMFISEHWDAHNSSRVPVILAGSLGGALKTGRTLDYLEAGNDRRKLCSLYLAIMDRMGLELPEFGDAKERLAGV